MPEPMNDPLAQADERMRKQGLGVVIDGGRTLPEDPLAEADRRVQSAMSQSFDPTMREHVATNVLDTFAKQGRGGEGIARAARIRESQNLMQDFPDETRQAAMDLFRQASIVGAGDTPEDMAKKLRLSRALGVPVQSLSDPATRKSFEDFAKWVNMPVHELVGTPLGNWMSTDPVNMTLAQGGIDAEKKMQELVQQGMTQGQAAAVMQARTEKTALNAQTSEGRDILSSVASALWAPFHNLFQLKSKFDSSIDSMLGLDSVVSARKGFADASLEDFTKTLAAGQKVGDKPFLVDQSTGKEFANPDYNPNFNREALRSLYGMAGTLGVMKAFSVAGEALGVAPQVASKFTAFVFASEAAEKSREAAAARRAQNGLTPNPSLDALEGSISGAANYLLFTAVPGPASTKTLIGTAAQQTARAFTLGPAMGAIENAAARFHGDAPDLWDGAIQRGLSFMPWEHLHTFSQAKALAVDSVLRKHDAAKWEEAMGRVFEDTPFQTANIRVNDLVRYFQTVGSDTAEHFAKAELGVTDSEWKLANAVHGELAIPMERWLNKVVATGKHEDLSNMIRLNNYEGTVKDAQDYAAAIKDMAQTVEAVKSMPVSDPARDAIRDQIVAELGPATHVFKANEVRDVADMFAKVITVSAKRVGMTPQELFDARRLFIARDAHDALTNHYGVDAPKSPEVVAAEASRIFSQHDVVKQRYNEIPETKGGKVINVDLARRLDPNFLKDPLNTVANHHDVVSDFVKRVYKERMNMPRESDGESVLFLAGGGGSGKGSALSQFKLDADAHTVVDGTLKSYGSARSMIEMALEKGRRVAIDWIYRPVDMAVNGTIARGHDNKDERGRFVGLDILADAHDGVPKTLLRLMDAYKDNPLVDFRAYDNSSNADGIREVPRSETRAFVEGIVKNRPDVASTAWEAYNFIRENGYENREGQRIQLSAQARRFLDWSAQALEPGGERRAVAQARRSSEGGDQEGRSQRQLIRDVRAVVQALPEGTNYTEFKRSLRERYGDGYQSMLRGISFGDLRGDAAMRKLYELAQHKEMPGAPPKIRTAAQRADLVERLVSMAEEGSAGRGWYDDSAKAFLQLAGDNRLEAFKLATLTALYSPQTTVPDNGRRAILAYYDAMQNRAISQGGVHPGVKLLAWKVGRAKTMEEVASVMRGQKTSAFQQNLIDLFAPEHANKDVATIDIHMMRSMGFENDSPSAPQYAWAEDVIREVASELGWSPKEAQAAVWVAQKARTEKHGIDSAAAHYGDAARAIAANVNVEATPSPKLVDSMFPNLANASHDQLLQYQREKMSIVLDALKSSGVLVEGFGEGHGYWMGESNPVTSFRIPMPHIGSAAEHKFSDSALAEIERAAKIVNAVVGDQDAVGWVRPFYATSVGEANGIHFELPRELTRDEMKKVGAAFDKLGIEAFIDASDPKNLKIVNYNWSGVIGDATGSKAAKQAKAYHELVSKVIMDALPENIGEVRSLLLHAESNLVEGGVNVEAAAQPGSDAKGPSVSDAGDFSGWRAQVESLNERFRTEFGWGGQRVGELPALPGREGGPADAISARGVHYSTVEGLDSIPASLRNGTASGETARLSGIDPSGDLGSILRRRQFYASEPGVLPKKEAVVRGDVPYEAMVHGLLDGSSQRALDLVAEAKRIAADATGPEADWMNQFERLVVENGYNGYKAGRVITLLGHDAVRVRKFVPAPTNLDSPTGGLVRLAQRVGPSYRPVDVQSEGFKRWFRDSKVVDENGAPAVFYHSTTRSSTLARIGAFGVPAQDIGTHFGTAGQAEDRNLFKTWGRTPEKAMRSTSTTPVYLSIQNPLRIPDIGDFNAQNMAQLLVDMFGQQVGDKPVPGSIRLMQSQLLYGNPPALEQVRAVVRDLGYDGFVYKNTGEAAGSHEYKVRLNDAMTNADKAFAKNDIISALVWSAKAKAIEYELGEFFATHGEDSYIVLDPGQIKSALSNTGEFGGKRLLHQEGVWRSVLTDSIPLMRKIGNKDGLIDPEQAKAWLKSKGPGLGIKSEEVQWSGINEWLDLQKVAGIKVSADDIQNYLREGGVQVEEVMKMTADEYLKTHKSPYGIVPAGQGVRYKNYQLPGGTDYRELLLKLPVYGHQTDIVQSNPHWDELSVLAHVRFNTRTDANGKKVLFIEELQSDWAQAGRDKGFTTSDPTFGPRLLEMQKQLQEHKKSVERAARAMQSAKGPAVDEARKKWMTLVNEHDAMIADYYAFAQPVADKMKPGPFITDTKAWVGLALKRMISYAAENGFDRVAFINGAQSADRYDLSKSADELVYVPSEQRIYAYKNGEFINQVEGVTDKNMADYIGKDAAAKMLQSSPLPAKDGSADIYHTITGDDLKVGGKGMHTFYDQIVPQITKDLLRKLGGGELSTMVLTSNETLVQAYLDGTQMSQTPMTKSEFDQNWGPNYEARSVGPEVMREHQQPVFDITPELRNRAEEGMALFQPGEGDVRGELVFGTKPDGSGRRSFHMSLLTAENRSTVFHELGHFYLELLGDMAGMASADPTVKEDYAKILNWFGVTSRDQITDVMHERFADAHLTYLKEGKAPTEELLRPMQKFSRWLARIWSVIRQDMVDVNMNDEVRGVFDRLYASEQEIEAAKGLVLSKVQLRADQLGMEPKQFAAYSVLVGKELETAKERLLGELMKDMNREQKTEYKAKFEELRTKFDEELLKRPEYRALKSLADGVMEDGTTKIKLSREDLVARYGAGIVNELAREGGRRVYTSDYGKEVVDTETAAMMLGFEDGSALVRALTGLEPRKVARDRMAREAIEKDHPSLLRDQEALHKEALAQLNGPLREQVLSMELAAFQKMARRVAPVAQDAVQRHEVEAMAAAQDRKALHGEQQRISADNASQAREARDSVKGRVAALRVAAKAHVESQSPYQLRPDRLLMDMRRANTDATNAALKGDYSAAYDLKEKALTAHFLYTESVRARAEAEKFDALLKRVDTSEVRAKLAKAGGSYLAQFDMLRDRFEVKRAPFTPVTSTDSLEGWVRSQLDEAKDPRIAEWLLNESLPPKPYRSLSLSEMRDLRDALVNIRHLAYQELGDIVNGQRVDFEQMHEEFRQAFEKNMPNRKPLIEASDPEHDTLKSRARAKLEGLDATLNKIELWVNWIDGNDVEGPAHRYIWNRVVEAQAREDAMVVKLNDRISKALEAMPKDERTSMADDRFDIGMDRPKTRDQIITMLLYAGQEARLEKLLSGYAAKGLTPEKLNTAFSKLTTHDVEFVKEVWATFDELKPQILDLEQRLTGLRPEWDEGRKFTITDASGKVHELEGGYFPLVADPEAVSRVADKQEGGTVQQVLSGNGYVRAATSTGHTKELTKASYPLFLNWHAVLTSGLANQVHDLTHREAVLGINRIIGNPGFRTLMRERIGKSYEQQMLPWLMNIASDRNAGASLGMAAINDIMLATRANTVAAVLGFKFSSIVVQFADLTRVVAPGEFRVGGLNLLNAYGKLNFLNPERGKYIEMIKELSPEMRHRAENLDRDLRARLQQLRGEHNLSANWSRAAFSGLAMMDSLVSWPTWLGAYQQSMKAHGNSEQAVKEADRTVRMRLMSGAPKDLPTLAANKHWSYKAITMFMGDATNNYNALRDAGHNINGFKGVPTFTAALVAVMLNQLLGDWLKGQGPNDKTDPEEWAKWTGRKMALAPFSTAPVMRDLGNVADNVLAGKPFTDYRFSPAVAGAQKAMIDPIIHTKRLNDGSEELGDYALHMLESGGYLFGVPGTAQFYGSAQYFKRYMEGGEQPANPAEFTYDLVTGKKKKEK